MSLVIEAVDPSEPASFVPFYEVYAAALRHGPQGEFATVWQLEEIRVAMADPDERRFRVGWAGRVGSEVVATGWMSGSTVDNTDVVDVLVCCHPDHRGRGYAASLLAHLEASARERGRSRALAEVVWPYGSGAEGAGSPELAWARRQGFELGLVDVQRRLAVPVPDGRLEALAAEAAPHHAAYTLTSFAGPVPEELVDGWAALTGSLMTEAPMGEIEREEEATDAAAIRAEETLLEQQGRVRLGTAALAGSGEVVAYSDLVLTLHESERAYQWGTLVHPGHRGHRLGLAVKAANLRLLQATQPQITTVITFNADVNAPMVAVNDRLGFRPVQWLGELQKKL